MESRESEMRYQHCRPPHFLSSNGSHPVIVWTEKARSWGGGGGEAGLGLSEWGKKGGARENVTVGIG